MRDWMGILPHISQALAFALSQKKSVLDVGKNRRIKVTDQSFVVQVAQVGE
jgi:hypothetical protein